MMWPFKRKEKRKNEDGRFMLTAEDKRCIETFFDACCEWEEVAYAIEEDYSEGWLSLWYRRVSDGATRDRTTMFTFRIIVVDHQGYDMRNPKIDEAETFVEALIEERKSNDDNEVIQ